MSRISASIVSTLLLLTVVHDAGIVAADSSLAAQQYQALVDQFEQEGGPRIFAKRFLELAETHPTEPASMDALVWILKYVKGRAETDRALQLLEKGFFGSERMESACPAVGQSRSVAGQRLLRALVDKSPYSSVRARACHELAVLLDREAGILGQLNAQPELAPRVLQYYGPEYGKHLDSLEPAELEKERLLVYQHMLDAFPKSEIQDTSLGQLAEKKLFEIRHLSVGKVAPEITGKDVFGEDFKLSDYRGKVVMLTFWGHW